MDEERWLPVGGKCIGYPYEVSDQGRVRSLCKGWRFHRVLSQFPDKDNYLRVNLYRDGKHIQVTVHSLVAETFNSVRPEGMTANHDGSKQDNRPGNLEWMTIEDNNSHALKSGRIRSGEKHPQAKLSDPEALRMIELYQTKTAREVAAEFGVSVALVKSVSSGACRKNLVRGH